MRPTIRTDDLLVPGLDGVVAFASIAFSFIVRFDAALALRAYFPQIVAVAGLAAVLKPAVFLGAGLYSVYWRYVSQREASRLLVAVVVASLVVGLSVAALQSPVAWLRGIPVSIFFVDLLATALGVAAIRFIVHARLAER